MGLDVKHNQREKMLEEIVDSPMPSLHRFQPSDLPGPSLYRLLEAQKTTTNPNLLWPIQRRFIKAARLAAKLAMRTGVEDYLMTVEEVRQRIVEMDDEILATYDSSTPNN